jgi:hypothetical protein
MAGLSKRTIALVATDQIEIGKEELQLKNWTPTMSLLICI